MAKYTKEAILQMAEEEDVEFIRLQFTDMFGTMKNMAITAGQLCNTSVASAARKGCKIDL